MKALWCAAVTVVGNSYFSAELHSLCIFGNCKLYVLFMHCVVISSLSCNFRNSEYIFHMTI